MSNYVEFGAERQPKTGKCHEMALDKAVRADCWWKINSKTSPIDLDRSHSDLDDPKIPKLPKILKFPDPSAS